MCLSSEHDVGVFCALQPQSALEYYSPMLLWLNEELRPLQTERKRKKNKVSASCLLLRLWCLLMSRNSRMKETLWFHNLSQFQNTFYLNKVWLVPHNCILLNLEWTSLKIIKLLTFGYLHSSTAHCGMRLYFHLPIRLFLHQVFEALFQFVGSDLLNIINDSLSPGFPSCFKHAIVQLRLKLF